MNKVETKTLIKDFFKNYDEIISLYIYGSFLNDNFNEKLSDIDLLLIVKDLEDPFVFINKIQRESKKIKELNLDINIVFKDEFYNRWHIYRPASYFLGVKYRNILILGEDLLQNIDDKDFTKEQMYKRLVDLAQSSRAIYVNDKDSNFWQKKYVKWLKIAVLELLFLTGEFDLNFVTGLEKLLVKYKELLFLNELNKGNLKIDEINKIAEELRVFFYKNLLMDK